MTAKRIGPVACVTRISAPLLVLSLLLPIAQIWAQQRLDPTAIGMGRASVATSRGLGALESNFGALGLDRMGARDSVQKVEIDLTVIPFGASAGSTYLSASDLDFVFASKNREDFSDADRLRLASLIEEGRLSADVALDLFNLRMRIPGVMALGFRYGHRVRAQMVFPENFRTTVLGSGDVFDHGEKFVDPEIGGEWTRSLGMVVASAWDRPQEGGGRDVWFPALGVGLNLNYVDGIVQFGIDPASYAATSRIPSAAGEPYRRLQVDGYYSFRSSRPLDSTFNPSNAILSPGFVNSNNVAGSGFEGGMGISMVILRRHPVVDQGVNGNPLQPEEFDRSRTASRDALTFGFQLEGVGSIYWDGLNQLRTYAHIRDTLSEKDGPISNDIIYRYEAPLDTIGGFRTQLPTSLRVGFGCDVTSFVPSIPGDLIASFEAAYDLNHKIGGERFDRYSLGAEWHPHAGLFIRSGMQFGGRLGAAMALGAGFQPFSWLSVDVATSEVTSLFLADRKRVDLSLRGSVHWAF